MAPSRRELARRLESVDDFSSPRVDLEQYLTPADVAAHVLHLASLRGDLAGRTAIDLGTGTGTFAIGATFYDPARVVGVDLDADALATARANERRVGGPLAVDWLRGDATRPPLSPAGPATVVSNPPFGARRDNRGADRAFLLAAADLAEVSYTIHNEGSREFVEALAADEGGTVTDAFRARFSLERRFSFHEEVRRDLDAEVFRIEWA